VQQRGKDEESATPSVLLGISAAWLAYHLDAVLSVFPRLDTKVAALVRGRHSEHFGYGIE
jgi:hypothetical protein